MILTGLDELIIERLEAYDLKPSGRRMDTVKSWIIWEEYIMGNSEHDADCIDKHIEGLYHIKKVADNKLSRKLYKGKVMKEFRGYLLVEHYDNKE